jgi:hypothetical protein
VTKEIFQRGRLIFGFEPCDFWIGGFYSRKERALYIILVPCLPFRWRFGDW